MKVLVTGGYGFNGSHVAERFFKEGYDVYIIDDLSSGNKNNVGFKHKGYELSVTDEKCEEIFRSNRFDAVIHLAAQIDVAESVRNPHQDSEANVLGLVHMLTLAQKYKAKKFIFASSAAVYGENDRLPLRETEPGNPLSPYGLSKLTGETYCAKWRELYGLDTLVFRFSNVYGPRQGGNGEGGVVSVFMDNLFAGEKLSVYGDGKQTRDFIYVQDVADAIFRSSYSALSGVYNLSTHTERSIAELAATLKQIHGRPVEIEYKESRAGDIVRSSLDNSRICKDLDWAPMYALNEGVAKTYAWFERQNELVRERERKSSADKRFAAIRPTLKKLLPYAENALAFIAMVWLTFNDWNELFVFMDINLIYIIVMGIIYGSRQSIVAVGLSIALVITKQLEDGRELLSLLYTTEFFFQIAVYLFVGLVIGYAIDRKNDIVREQIRRNEELNERYRFLGEVYADVRSVKDELLQRIMTSEESIGKIYSITKSLESLEPEQVVSATVDVVASTLEAGQVSIYMANKEGTYLRLAACSDGANNMQKSIRVEDADYMKQLIGDGGIFRNKTLTEGVPLMAAPIRNSGRTIAVIIVDELPFHKFSAYQENLFRVVVDLVTSSFTRALSYIDATEDKRYVSGTAVLMPEAFQAIVAVKREARGNHGVPFLLMKGVNAEHSLHEFSEKASKLLRETDYIGLDGEGGVAVILSNTDIEHVGQVIERFNQHGLTVELMEEERIYG